MSKKKLLNNIREDSDHCYFCGKKFSSTKDKTIDHYYPSVRGGKTTRDNLVCCCKECNGIKDNLTGQEFEVLMKEAEKICDKYNLMLEMHTYMHLKKETKELVYEKLNVSIAKINNKITVLNNKILKEKCIIDAINKSSYSVVKNSFSLLRAKISRVLEAKKKIKEYEKEIEGLKSYYNIIVNYKLLVKELKVKLNKTLSKEELRRSIILAIIHKQIFGIGNILIDGYTVYEIKNVVAICKNDKDVTNTINKFSDHNF